MLWRRTSEVHDPGRPARPTVLNSTTTDARNGLATSLPMTYSLSPGPGRNTLCTNKCILLDLMICMHAGRRRLVALRCDGDGDGDGCSVRHANAHASHIAPVHNVIKYGVCM